MFKHNRTLVAKIDTVIYSVFITHSMKGVLDPWALCYFQRNKISGKQDNFHTSHLFFLISGHLVCKSVWLFMHLQADKHNWPHSSIVQCNPIHTVCTLIIRGKAKFLPQKTHSLILLHIWSTICAGITRWQLTAGLPLFMSPLGRALIFHIALFVFRDLTQHSLLSNSSGGALRTKPAF